MSYSLKFEITGCLFWLSSPVHSGSLKRIDYPKQLSGPTFFFCMSPLLLKELIIIFLLAHLSRRLIGELIGYSWSGVSPSSVVVRRSQCSNIFFSKTAWPIKAKFYVGPPWVGGTKICSRHVGHMTKMAATPIYGKNPSKIFSRTGWPIFTKLGM